MTSIQRYDHEIDGCEPADDGTYVTYTDHERVVHDAVEAEGRSWQETVENLLDRAQTAEHNAESLHQAGVNDGITAAVARLAALREDIALQMTAGTIEYDQRFLDGLSHAWSALLTDRNNLPAEDQTDTAPTRTWDCAASGQPCAPGPRATGRGLTEGTRVWLGWFRDDQPPAATWIVEHLEADDLHLTVRRETAPDIRLRLPLPAAHPIPAPLPLP